MDSPLPPIVTACDSPVAVTHNSQLLSGGRTELGVDVDMDMTTQKLKFWML